MNYKDYFYYKGKIVEEIQCKYQENNKDYFCILNKNNFNDYFTICRFLENCLKNPKIEITFLYSRIQRSDFKITIQEYQNMTITQLCDFLTDKQEKDFKLSLYKIFLLFKDKICNKYINHKTRYLLHDYITCNKLWPIFEKEGKEQNINPEYLALVFDYSTIFEEIKLEDYFDPDYLY